MRFKIFILAVIYVALGFNLTHAANPARCYWQTGGGSDDKTVSSNLSRVLTLKADVPVGSVMGSMVQVVLDNSGNVYRWAIFCGASSYRVSYFIEKLTLVEGYNDVYKTNVAGVGVRISDGIIPLPYTKELVNVGTYPLLKIKLEFVRTSLNIESGEVNFDFNVVSDFSGWTAMREFFSGTTKLEIPAYFSGCTGVEKLNIAMGRISLADLGGARQKPFNLDVLCSGAAAGTKIPVKVYFEGSSDGPGRLNLESGGAKGVEISLLNDRGVKLPFSQGSALDMTWTRSEPNGEIYRLPVVAEYVKKAAQKVEPGKANATVNYILEYN